MSSLRDRLRLNVSVSRDVSFGIRLQFLVKVLAEAFVDSVVFCSLGLFLVLTKGSCLLFTVVFIVVVVVTFFHRHDCLLEMVVFVFLFFYGLLFCVERFRGCQAGRIARAQIV